MPDQDWWCEGCGTCGSVPVLDDGLHATGERIRADHRQQAPLCSAGYKLRIGTPPAEVAMAEVKRLLFELRKFYGPPVPPEEMPPADRYATANCAYCGYTGLKKPRAEAVVETLMHGRTCPKHPLYQALAERDKLQAFKDWVHTYLDHKDVPHHPPGVHGAEGCRIGDRLDWVFARFDVLRTAAKPLLAILRHKEIRPPMNPGVQERLEAELAAALTTAPKEAERE